MQPEVSVIIPTYNGAKKIPVLLEALRKQTFLDFELIVVIDGSMDDTQQIVKETEMPFSKKIITQPNQGRATVKNNGARQARGDIMIFFDDDMEPNPHSIEKHLAFHVTHYGLLTGNQIERKEHWKTDIQNYKASLSEKWTRKYSLALQELTPTNLFFTAANCSIRKNVFDQLGGFDDRLTDGEDYELALRALENKIPVYFDRMNEAVHHDLITCVGYINRLRQYYAAHEKVNSFHTQINLSTKPVAASWKNIFYSIFALPVFPKMIDRFNLFLILPKMLRYQLYNVIIHSLSKIHYRVPL